jgi:hypothetical protein
MKTLIALILSVSSFSFANPKMPSVINCQLMGSTYQEIIVREYAGKYHLELLDHRGYRPDNDPVVSAKEIQAMKIKVPCPQDLSEDYDVKDCGFISKNTNGHWQYHIGFYSNFENGYCSAK